jgi:TonB family protein
MTSSLRASYLTFIALLIIWFGVGVSLSQAPLDDQDWQQYIHLIRASTVNLRNTEPFHLKISFELRDLNGKPVEKGIAEETWGASGIPQVHIDAPSLQEDEPSDVGVPAALARRESYLVKQVLQSLVRPIDITGKQANFHFDSFQQSFDTTPYNCVAILLPGTIRDSATTAYCLDADSKLRVVTGNGSLVIRRDNFRTYRDRKIPLDIEISYGGKVAITAHVEDIEPLPPEPAAAPSGTASGYDLKNVPVEPGAFLKRSSPKYPKLAKAAHITGTVVLTAIITKEGTIAGLDVVASPDALLSKSSLDVVKTWTYKPYLLSGAPTVVDTTIYVNYNMGQ